MDHFNLLILAFIVTLLVRTTECGVTKKYRPRHTQKLTITDHNGQAEVANSPLRLRSKRYALAGKKWYQSDLTYKINSYPSDTDMSKSEVDDTIEEAFAIWEEHVPITFTKVDPHKAAVIVINFRNYEGKIYSELARAFYPGFFPQDGDIDFDDLERWTYMSAGKEEYASLLYVAVHELGHVLGISHSEYKGAVMYKSVPSHVHSVQLSPDDICAVKRNYGIRDVTMCSLSESLMQSQSKREKVYKWILLSIIIFLSFLLIVTIICILGCCICTRNKE